MKRVLFTAFISLAAILSLPICCVAASRPIKPDAKFTQLILPENCQFQTVNDGLNTIIYLTPANCQLASNPPQKPDLPQTPADNSSGNAAQIPRGTIIPSLYNPPATKPQIPNQSIVDLSDRPAQKLAQGLLVTAKAGLIYQYRPLLNSSGPEHQLIITNVTKEGATVLLQPSNQLISLTTGQEVKADYSHDGKPTVAITLVKHISPTKILLNIRLLAYRSIPSTSPSSSKADPVIILVAVTSVVSLGLVYRSIRHIVLRR